MALTGVSDVQVTGPSWSLRGDSPLEREARLAAVRAAVTRARDDAAALGATLGDLLDLSDTDATLPRAFALSAAGGGSRPPAELDLEPQPQSVTASVVARFALTDVPPADALPA